MPSLLSIIGAKAISLTRPLSLSTTTVLLSVKQGTKWFITAFAPTYVALSGGVPVFSAKLLLLIFAPLAPNPNMAELFTPNLIGIYASLLVFLAVLYISNLFSSNAPPLNG